MVHVCRMPDKILTKQVIALRNALLENSLESSAKLDYCIECITKLTVQLTTCELEIEKTLTVIRNSRGIESLLMSSDVSEIRYTHNTLRQDIKRKINNMDAELARKEAGEIRAFLENC